MRRGPRRDVERLDAEPIAGHSERTVNGVPAGEREHPADVREPGRRLSATSRSSTSVSLPVRSARPATEFGAQRAVVVDLPVEHDMMRPSGVDIGCAPPGPGSMIARRRWTSSTWPSGSSTCPIRLDRGERASGRATAPAQKRLPADAPHAGQRPRNHTSSCSRRASEEAIADRDRVAVRLDSCLRASL